MGRPSKLTPEVQDRIARAITAGNYQDTAAQYAGISPATFYLWMQKAEGARHRRPGRQQHGSWSGATRTGGATRRSVSW